MSLATDLEQLDGFTPLTDPWFEMLHSILQNYTDEEILTYGKETYPPVQEAKRSQPIDGKTRIFVFTAGICTSIWILDGTTCTQEFSWPDSMFAYWSAGNTTEYTGPYPM